MRKPTHQKSYKHQFSKPSFMVVIDFAHPYQSKQCSMLFCFRKVTDKNVPGAMHFTKACLMCCS